MSRIQNPFALLHHWYCIFSYYFFARSFVAFVHFMSLCLISGEVELYYEINLTRPAIKLCATGAYVSKLPQIGVLGALRAMVVWRTPSISSMKRQPKLA